jgi:cytochrome c55X
LQREQVANKPVPYLAYTILHGRPGTAMPPWSRFLTEEEGEWLARELRGENP